MKKAILLVFVVAVAAMDPLMAAPTTKSLYDLTVNIANLISSEHLGYIKIHGKKKATDTAMGAVRDKMKDPGSVQFRNVKSLKYNGGVLLCGEFNAKNGYGAYTGYQPFIAGGIMPSDTHSILSPRQKSSNNFIKIPLAKMAPVLAVGSSPLARGTG